MTGEFETAIDRSGLEPGRPPPLGSGRRVTVSTIVVATAVGVTSMSFNVWWPFLPLYLVDLGATSDADALFWMAVATTVQGITRLAVGPIWGVLSDQYGRKAMLLRALYLSSVIGAVAAAVQEPWQLAIALGLAGVFSGFNPAAIAFISVSVPDSRLSSSLGIVTGANYLGSTIGPALGALLTIVLDFRAAILVTSAVPLITGTLVLLLAPADRAARSRPKDDEECSAALEPFHFSLQLFLGVLLVFLIFALNQLVRLATPIALRGIEGAADDVKGVVGLTFTVGGLSSAVSVLLLAPRVFVAGKLARSTVIAVGVAAAGFVILGFAGTTALFVLGFVVIAFVLSAMTPAANTLVAANASRARRGTAFGIASSAQALSFGIGPAAAALFAAVSLELGFFVIALLLLAVALLLLILLREPSLDQE